jgi:two-component system, OmpR family, response regulator CpxR
MPKILIADDDKELCQLLADYLVTESFDVSQVYNGEQAIAYAQKNQFDLIILDVMMPLKSGFEVLSEVRKSSSQPIIMLTAKGDKIDRIVGLEMGADDYVAKPCDPRELVARIRAVLRRANPQARSTGISVRHDQQAQQLSLHSDIDEANSTYHIVNINQLSLDKHNREVSITTSNETSAIDLTGTEFDILQLLIDHAGKLVSREKISRQCLGKSLQVFDRSIDMHLSNLRKKLGCFADKKPRIKTVRGCGYQYLIWPDND